MGRPRKRQFIESNRDEPINTQNNGLEPLPDAGTIPPFFGDGFNDFNDANLTEPYFTDSNFTGHEPAQQPPQTLPINTANSPWSLNTHDGRIIGHFGDRDMLGDAPIDFSNMDMSKRSENSPLANHDPELSTGLNPSFSSPSGSDGLLENSGGNCSCLPSMYLSLAALQQFPSEIGEALRVVRGASVVASKAIWVSTFLIHLMLILDVEKMMEKYLDYVSGIIEGLSGENILTLECSAPPAVSLR